MYRKIKGFRDIYGSDIPYWQFVEDTFRDVFNIFGYNEIKIPVMEKVDLFKRSIGGTTDIVEKEMFAFKDINDDYLALRPEGTASTVRAYVENKLYNPRGIHKFYYYGPMFRRERPQKGRFRQFYQAGVEVFGSDSPLIDAEVIRLLEMLFEDCGVSEYVDLEINSIGCNECRPKYRKKLIDFFKDKEEDLCADCKRRLETNPLRILDCKIETCKEVASDAPLITGHLCENCGNHFDEVKKYLDILGIDYKINGRMVRGLDYYVRTAFEFVTSKLGASSAVGAGGRYDGLIKLIGGPDLPGIGFAVGVDRLVELVKEKEIINSAKTDFYVICFKDISDELGIKLTDYLRSEGYKVEMDVEFAGIKSQMKKANKANASFVLIFGEDEIKEGKVSIKNMETGEQIQIDFTSFEELKNLMFELMYIE